MNRELGEVIKLYTTRPNQDLNSYLLSKSKNTLIALLADLITMYINDKNSSALREFITVTIAGYNHVGEKIGYNGYKQHAYGKPLMCEAKPVNVTSSGNKKLNGGGNFTDYTHERLERDLKEDLHMLVSGFVDGRLIYILEFPFNCDTFVSKLEKQLSRRFPEGDVSGQFLRSASFYYQDYINCKNLKVVFCLSKPELEKYKDKIVKNFYNFLIGVAPDD